MTLLTAWIAKEKLRDLLACARTGADHHRVGHLRFQFLTWCADSEIPEVRQMAVTLDRWWPEIAAFIATGHSNAMSVLRTRCVTTRRARGHLHPNSKTPHGTARPPGRWTGRDVVGREGSGLQHRFGDAGFKVGDAPVLEASSTRRKNNGLAPDLRVVRTPSPAHRGE